MTSPRYFGGSSRNLGEAKGLAAKTFHDFAHLLIGAPVVLPLTRGQYEALDKPARMTAKRVNWFTPATFKTNPSTTGKENVTGANLVVLDLDDPAQAAPLAKPATLASLLQPFSWVAYRTASSTPSCPRLRIVVDAELGADDYLGAVFTVARLLGVEVNRESKRTAQPSFLPSLFAGEDPDKYHPMLGCETGGRAFLPSDIDPEALVGAETPVGHDGHAAPAPSGDGLEYLRAPMPGVTLAACREALNHLNPDMPMHDWVQVAFALKHQFQGERETDAYNLFLEWSAKGSKYAGEKDIETRWRSCKVATLGRAPVTARSLLRMATTSGWKGMMEVSKQAFEELDRKITSLKTPVELLEQAPKLLAHSTLSPVERGALIGQVLKMAKQLGITLGRKDIEKSVARLVKAGSAGDGEGGGKSMPDWARGWVYVAGEDEFFNPPKGTKRQIEAFDHENTRHVAGDDDEDRAPKPSKLLLNTYLCPVVDGYQYDPSRPEEVVFEDELGRVWANTYTARYPRGDALGADEARRIFLGHLRRLVGDEDATRRLMDWLAYHVQAPGRKVRWAPLIQGTQGCGKSYLAEVMAAVLGEPNVKRLDAGQVLEDNFNGWGNEAQLVVLEEVRVVGESRFKVMNKLKPLITNSTVSIRRMYREAVNAKNVTNYLLLTNFLDSLPVDDNDRRYFVIHSPLQTKAQKEAIIDPHNFEMWDRLHANASGFRAMFEEWQISLDFNPDGDAPHTASRAELVRNTETPLSSLLRRLVEEATNPLITNEFVSLTALRHEADVENLRNITGQVLSQACREAGYTMAGRQRMADGERHSVWRRIGVPQVVYDEDGI